MSETPFSFESFTLLGNSGKGIGDNVTGFSLRGERRELTCRVERGADLLALAMKRSAHRRQG